MRCFRLSLISFSLFVSLAAMGVAHAQPIESVSITLDGDALLIDLSTADQAWSAQLEQDTYLAEGVALISVSVKIVVEAFIKAFVYF